MGYAVPPLREHGQVSALHLIRRLAVRVGGRAPGCGLWALGRGLLQAREVARDYEELLSAVTHDSAVEVAIFGAAPTHATVATLVLELVTAWQGLPAPGRSGQSWPFSRDGPPAEFGCTGVNRRGPRLTA